MKYTTVDKDIFKNHIKNMKSLKSLTFYFDIETYLYNKNEGVKKPTFYKNCIYSFAVSYFYCDDLYICIFSNVKEFIDSILSEYEKYKKVPTIQLIAHNNNKYDNHFLNHDLKYFYDLEYTNLYVMNANKSANRFSKKITELTQEEIQKGIILEKRIKSKSNLELVFFIKGIQFYTTDNYVKTNSSIATLGKKLRKLNIISDEELKTDYDYTKYDLDNNLSEEQAKIYGEEIFNNLSDDEIKYIKNDVIILALSVKYYSSIFKGFDYSKMTFTSNILESYNINDLTSYQLLHRIGKGKNVIDLKYTEFQFNNQNLYDYLKSFYNGGLNFYNYKYLGQIINEEVYGMDINSSYPYAMHSKKIPTFLRSYGDYEKETEINVSEIENQKDTYTLYRITKLEFDNAIILKIKSEVIKQLLVKYYGKTETININSYTIKMIENITDLKINKLNVLSYMTYDCLYFGANNILEEYYRIKTQGQNKHKMNMEDLYNIFPTDEEVDTVYTEEEIAISKLNLNGLYGIPALRPYFNIFRWQGEQLNNIENGFANSQRNVLFSVFVTSVSLYNLLDPFSYMEQEEIDDNFLYCDTDSLYWKKKIVHKLPTDLFNPNNLGKWDIQNESIDKFYILNHKKYCYLENGKINVKSGGIPNNAFNTNLPFEEFIETQFSDGVELKNIKSINNIQGTVSIYESITKLEQGKPYASYSYNKKRDKEQKELFKEIQEDLRNDPTGDDTLYIETNYGTYSLSDFFPVTHTVKNRFDMEYYLLKETSFRNKIK